LRKEIAMPSRELSFPVFDADNHMYEPQEALTTFLPDKLKRVIDYAKKARLAPTKSPGPSSSSIRFRAPQQPR
jgi:hypothetical protein